MSSTFVTSHSAPDPEMFAFLLQKGKTSQLFQYFLFPQGTTESKKPGGRDARSKERASLCAIWPAPSPLPPRAVQLQSLAPSQLLGVLPTPSPELDSERFAKLVILQTVFSKRSVGEVVPLFPNSNITKLIKYQNDESESFYNFIVVFSIQANYCH